MIETLVAQTIVYLCVGEESFLVRLHSHAIFDVDQYSALKQALHSYVQQIDSQSIVQRDVVGCIFALHEEFLNYLETTNRNPRTQEARRHVEAEYNELRELILLMFHI